MPEFYDSQPTGGPIQPSGNGGRGSEFNTVPYGNDHQRRDELYQMPTDLLSFNKDTVQEEISRVKEAIDRVQSANKLMPYWQKFIDEWNIFLRNLMQLRKKLARGEILKAQFEAESRMMTATIAAALEKLMLKENEHQQRTTQRVNEMRQNAQRRLAANQSQGYGNQRQRQPDYQRR